MSLVQFNCWFFFLFFWKSGMQFNLAIDVFYNGIKLRQWEWGRGWAWIWERVSEGDESFSLYCSFSVSTASRPGGSESGLLGSHQPALTYKLPFTRRNLQGSLHTVYPGKSLDTFRFLNSSFLASCFLTLGDGHWLTQREFRRMLQSRHRIHDQWIQLLV